LTRFLFKKKIDNSIQRTIKLRFSMADLGSCTDKSEKMSFWDLINLNKVDEEKIASAIAAGKTPTVSSSKELEIFLKYKIGDAEFAKIFTQILDKIGRNGTVDIKKGGDGSPYQVEYVSSGLRKMMTKKEVKKRTTEIIERLEKDNSLSDKEMQKLQKELADSHAIIWVNSKTREDFVIKEQLFSNAVIAAEQVLSKMR